MGKFAVGEVVLVKFPFSNLKGQKIRPALVVAKAERNDLVLCQITSKPYASKLSILIMSNDFTKGGLPVDSYVRPNKLFTANPSIIKKSAGHLTPAATETILNTLRGLFTR